MKARTSALYSAALRAYPDEALRSLTRALGIGEDTDAFASDHFPDYPAWARMDTSARLFAIASWLRAECAATANHITDPANFVTVEDPLHTVGTRD